MTDDDGTLAFLCGSYDPEGINFERIGIHHYKVSVQAADFEQAEKIIIAFFGLAGIPHGTMMRYLD